MPNYTSFSEYSGNGTEDGTIVTTANDNDAGNVDLESGATAEATIAGTPNAVYAAPGITVPATATTQTFYLALTHTPANAHAIRAYYKPSGAPVSDCSIIVHRGGGAFQGYLRHRASGVLQTANSSNTIVSGQVTPALINDHTYQIDQIWKKGSTTANGRSILMITDLDSHTWATGGVYYHDTGDTVATGANTQDTLRFGKTSSVQQPEFNISYVAWAPVPEELPAQATANTDMAIGRKYFLPSKYGFFLWNGTTQEPLDLQEGNGTNSPNYIHPEFEESVTGGWGMTEFGGGEGWGL